MGLQIGDVLFGYPIVGITDDTVTVRLPQDITIEYGYKQFTANVLAILAAAGDYIPKP